MLPSSLTTFPTPMSELSTPRTHTTGQFEAVRGVINAPETSSDQLLAIRAKLAQETEQVNNRLRGRLITPDQAREILGPDLFLGADTLKKTRGIKLPKEVLNQIPLNLTEQDALECKRLNHRVSLHSDKLADGQPLTMLSLNDDVKQRNKGKLLYNTDWYKQESLAASAGTLEYRETSSDVVQGTLGQDYLDSTDSLIRYLKTERYKGRPLPAEYEDAIKEYEEKRSDLAQMNKNWDKPHASGQKNWYVAAEIFANLQITQLTRPTPNSIVQDIAMKPMLQSTYTWTSASLSGGGLVGVGNADSRGALVSGWGPDDRRGYLGASFSRSLSK